MKRRKILILGCLGILLFLIGTGLFTTILLPDRINEENFEKIQEGMTVEDVEEILGRSNHKGTISDSPSYSWIGEEVVIFVAFNGQGKVIDKVIDFREQLSLWKRMASWFGLE